MEWFYYVKFAVVSAIALAFSWFSLSRVIASLKGPPPPKKVQRIVSTDNENKSQTPG